MTIWSAVQVAWGGSGCDGCYTILCFPYRVRRSSMWRGTLVTMPGSGHFRAQRVVRNAGNWSKASWEVKRHFGIVDGEPSYFH